MYNLKHYLCLFVVFFTILKYSFQPSMLCLIASLLSVQVIHNATCNVTFLGNQTELVLAFLCHAWIPLYLHAWSDNFMMFSMKTSTVLAFFLLLSIVVRSYASPRSTPCADSTSTVGMNFFLKRGGQNDTTISSESLQFAQIGRKTAHMTRVLRISKETWKSLR